jgi:Sulfatase
VTSRTYTVLKLLCVFLTVCLGSSGFWMLRTFGVVSLSQTATLLILDMGAGAVPWEITRHLIEWVFVFPAAVTALAFLSARLERRGRRPAALAALAVILLFMVGFSLRFNFGWVPRWHKSTPSGGNIFDQYNPPPATVAARQKPLNIIWIFVESLESEYSDPAINAELEKSTSFMAPLTVSPLINRYTVGGVMSAKCGAPIYFTTLLVLQFHDAGFNHATCFDDVLRANGYQSYFVVGHDASLSGFRRYYEKHASAHIYDQISLAAAHVPKDSTFPTYPDHAVFDAARGILKSPALSRPFSLNILTYDNHAPDGVPSNNCKANYGTDIASVIRCDNHSLAAFIDELNRSGQLQDTVLVVMGDHPFAGAFSQVLASRQIFARIYTPLSDRKVLNSNPTPFDFFPSVLSAMGFDPGQKQYGFGYSFYDVPDYPMRDWKSWIASFPVAEPTSRYKALF